MPKIVDKSEKRSMIIESATRILARKGYQNTRIAEIAKEAGIGKGTIYEYFQSKDEIFSASFQTFMSEIQGIIARHIQGVSDPLERLRSYFFAWTEIFNSAHIKVMEIMLDFWAEGVRRKQNPGFFDLTLAYREHRKFLATLLREGMDQGKIIQADEGEIASIFIGALDGILIQWILDRDVFDLKRACERMGGVILRGLKPEPFEPVALDVKKEIPE